MAFGQRRRQPYSRPGSRRNKRGQTGFSGWVIGDYKKTDWLASVKIWLKAGRNVALFLPALSWVAGIAVHGVRMDDQRLTA